jgi:hypothetical protein
MRLLATAVFVLTVTTACGSGAADGGARACTAMGSPSGVAIEVDPALVAKVDRGAFDVCWNGDCRSYPIAFNKMPDTFADVPGLPAHEVEVTVRIHDHSGAEVLERTLAVTPVPTYPNGRECGADGVRVLLLVDANGAVRAGVPRFA